MIINGYRIKTTELGEIEEKIRQVRIILKKTGTSIYHRQLGEEIAFLCDNIALNILPRDFQGKSIYERALDNLEQKMHTAEMTAAPAEYNLQIYAHLMSYEGYTYIKVICPNTELLKAFKHLEPYSLSEIECQDKRNRKTEIWQKLHALYKDNEPLSLNLTPTVIPDRDRIVFPDKKARCSMCARHKEVNRLLNQIAGGQQIPPFLLMNYMDTAMSMLFQDDIKHELAKHEMELQKILPDLASDADFIFSKNETDEFEQQEKKNQKIIQCDSAEETAEES